MEAGVKQRYDIIIVGAGLAGACSALWLCQSRRVLLVEAAATVSAGASGVAAGIVNPFAGQRAHLLWQGDAALEAFDATLDAAGASSLYRKTGVVRPAAEGLLAERLRFVAQGLPRQATWIGPEEARARFPGIVVTNGALLTHNGGVVDAGNLVRAMVRMARMRGAQVRTRTRVSGWGEDADMAYVTAPDDAGRIYASHILLTMGHGYRQFAALRSLNLTTTKGQVVRIASPDARPSSLSRPICGNGYVAPDGETLIVGTSYERGFADTEPSEHQTSKILHQAALMAPCIKGQRILGATAGVRVGVPGTRLPMVGPLSERIWIFTGLGSKGLLFSALIASKLPAYLHNPERIPRAICVSYRKPARV